MTVEPHYQRLNFKSNQNLRKRHGKFYWPLKLTITICGPTLSPGTVHASWVPLALVTVHIWEPNITLSLVGSLPNRVPVIVIEAASEILAGEAEDIVGAIEYENS